MTTGGGSVAIREEDALWWWWCCCCGDLPLTLVLRSKKECLLRGTTNEGKLVVVEEIEVRADEAFEVADNIFAR
jgi:hypothetical protein